MMTTISIRSANKKAISAIKTLAKELEMEVNEPAKKEKSAGQHKWEELIAAGVIVPGDPSVKIAESAGIWTGRNLTLEQLRKKGWKRKIQ
ncbi:hypothetical protein [Compostibacter hankyongensis]|uniref:Uncharacterized protein n=1 Tax=Compostibacter hankyongensis TaxID=1007089 RepID=A0ABP8FSE4_9BACT